MLEGKDLILATKDFAVEHRGRSWFHLGTTALVLLICYGALFSLDVIWLRLIISIVTGLTLVRMFVIYHDYLHKSILQKSVFARAWFYVFGLYILAPFSIWRRSHDYHHKHNSKLYTASIGSFPIATRKRFLSASKRERRLYLITRHPLTILFGYLIVFMYGMCIRSLMASPRRHWDSLVGILVHITLGVLIWVFAGFTTFFLAFLLPLTLATAVGSYLFYAQHNFPGVTFASKDGWTYHGAALDSSSFMRMNTLMHWFTGNIGYHHIHHLNARIPFYRLPEAYGSIEELRQAKETSLRPSEIWRCLRLKVWDAHNGKMLTMKQLRASVPALG